MGYQAPYLAADHFAKIGLAKDIKILDTACGTGLCAMLVSTGSIGLRALWRAWHDHKHTASLIIQTKSYATWMKIIGVIIRQG